MERQRTFGSLIFVRSNMKIKKVGAYANAIAKDNGLFAENGTALLVMKLSKKDQDEFNGKKKSKKKDTNNDVMSKLKDKIIKK